MGTGVEYVDKETAAEVQMIEKQVETDKIGMQVRKYNCAACLCT